MIWLIAIIVIMIIGGAIFTMVGAGIESHIDRKQAQLNNDLDRTTSIWENRVNELGINLNECYKLLMYYNNSFLSGIYIYAWKDSDGINLFNSTEKVGNTEFVSSPSRWIPEHIPYSSIDDVYIRQDYCQLMTNNRSFIFDIKEFDKIKELIQ